MAIEPLWPGETFVIVGSGPSLSREDTEQLIFRDLRIIAVNDAYRLLPWADVLYAADAQWWNWKRAVADRYLPPLKFTAQPEALTYRPSAMLVNVVKGDGISTDPGKICSGGHSGHQAINLAVHLAGGRPRGLILLGFDMQPGPTGQNHFFGEHPHGYKLNYPDKVRRFATLAADLARLNIPIVNCSRQTAIPESMIPRRPLADVLPDCALSAQTATHSHDDHRASERQRSADSAPPGYHPV